MVSCHGVDGNDLRCRDLLPYLVCQRVMSSMSRSWKRRWEVLDYISQAPIWPSPPKSADLPSCIGVNKRGDDAMGVMFTHSSVPVAHAAWVVLDGTNSKEDLSTTPSTGPYGCGLRFPLVGVEGSELSLTWASCGQIRSALNWGNLGNWFLSLSLSLRLSLCLSQMQI